MIERYMHLRFATPQFLLLAGLLPVIVWMGKRSIAGLGKARARTAIAVRLLVLVGLCAALSRVQIVRVRDDVAVAFVVDRSLSVPTGVEERVLERVDEWQGGESRRKGDKVALVTFGANAAIDQWFTEEKLDTSATRAVIEAGHTNLAAALRSAIAAMPEAGHKRVILITDGNENNGSAVSEAASAKSAGVRVDCLPIRYDYPNEVMVEKVVVPSEVAPGRTVSVRVIVRAYTTAAAALRLFGNGVLLASQEVMLKPGVNAFVIDQVLNESGVYDFEATVECQADTLYQNNRATAFSVVRGPKRMLIVEGKAGDAELLAACLSEEKVGVDLVTPTMLPDAASVLSRYDTVILVNVAAFDLPEGKIEMLERAVKDYGLGLVMVGGEDSFGAGGWRGTLVEEAMPVSMDIKDRQVVPTGALVIINHSCEFPDGNRWGVNISKAALNTLGEYDEFGLLAYGIGEQWIIRLQPVTNREQMKARIEGMQIGDMPSFDLTLKMAETALKKSQAAVKHVVIISDGDPDPPTPQLLQRISDAGITISTVIIDPHFGSWDVKNMQAIAEACKGRFYYPRSPQQLPQIFIKEARIVRRGLISEKAFVPRMVMPTVPLEGFADGIFPQLKGHVITTPKKLAETPLVTGDGDPLLAHWQYGLGRTVAFTSDARPKWAADWVDWEHFRRFWGQIAEWAERKIETGDFTTSVSVRGEEAKIAIDAVGEDGEFVNFLEFGGTLLSPSGEAQELSLGQTGPGHYEGTFKASEVGTYLPLLRYTDGQGETRTQMVPVTIPFSAEYRALSTNEVLLKEISEITGGKVIGEDADVFSRDFVAAASYTDIWQWVLSAAIALFLFDVFVRRVILDYAKIGSAALAWLSYLPGLHRYRPARAGQPAYTARLLSAKKGVMADRKRAAAKFEPGEKAAAGNVLDEVAREEAFLRARAAAVKRAEGPVPEEIAREAADEPESFTSRLLKAKERAKRERDRNK